MILVDLSQVILSALFVQSGSNMASINESLIRHTALNCIRSYRQKFGNKYGRIVICADNKIYWRKSFFPYYKANRKKDRENSDYDWKMILDTVQSIKEDIRDFFPYKVMDVDGAEADDTIGVLCRKYHTVGPTLVLSGDKDFGQLQRYPNIAQYSPIQAQWIKIDDPKTFIKAHIMRGDRGDGIPNFLSPDDTFVRPGGRQKPLSDEKIKIWANMEPEQFCTTQMMKGYKRNEGLIDLEKIPPNIQVDILNSFEMEYNGDRSRMFGYFLKHKMKLLMECINEF